MQFLTKRNKHFNQNWKREEEIPRMHTNKEQNHTRFTSDEFFKTEKSRRNENAEKEWEVSRNEEKKNQKYNISSSENSFRLWRHSENIRAFFFSNHFCFDDAVFLSSIFFVLFSILWWTHARNISLLFMIVLFKASEKWFLLAKRMTSSLRQEQFSNRKFRNENSKTIRWTFTFNLLIVDFVRVSNYKLFFGKSLASEQNPRKCSKKKMSKSERKCITENVKCSSRQEIHFSQTNKIV